MAVLAWLVFPLLSAAVCLGIGLLAERAARARLHPALLPALGYAAATAVLGLLDSTGAGGTAGAVLLVVLALAGFALARAELPARLRPRLGAASGVAVYAVYIAPVALSGTVTFLGYNLLNDTAIHLAIVDWISSHGSRFVQQPPSSYGAAVNTYVGTHYPLGSHELLAALRPLTALDAARVYQPFLALSAAVAAPALYALIRRTGAIGARTAALAAAAALCGQLVFSFALQGGIKELSFIACLAAASALAAYGEVGLMALAAGALYGIYGVYALPWILPLALVALWVVRPALRALLTAVGIFLAAVSVQVPGSIHYWRHGHDVITSGAELGPLAGPLQPLQAAGIWLSGDYRFPPSHSWLTYALAAVCAAFAVWGTCWAWRRQRALLLFALPALVAWAATAPASSPYIDAKLLAVLSPAVVLMAAVGATVIRRRFALAVALTLLAALLVSDALAYRVALVAPAARLDELAQIDRRFAGRGPVLVNEYEEYTKHFMRRSRGSDPYEGWSAGRAQLRDARLPVAAHAYDLDQLRTGFVERWSLIVLRRSPVESRPPSNYVQVWNGRFYSVWQRTGPAPLMHVALGHPPLDPTQPLSCATVRHLAGRGQVVAALRARPLSVPIATASPLPAGWYPSGDGALTTNKGGRIATSFTGHGAVHIWLRGRAFRKLAVLVDGREVGSVRELNGPNQWMDAGGTVLSPGAHRLELVRPIRSLGPGDAQRDVIGPVAVTADVQPRLVRGAALRRACGAPADWIDVVRR